MSFLGSDSRPFNVPGAVPAAPGGILGVLGLLAFVSFGRLHHLPLSKTGLALTAMACVILPVALYELVVLRVYLLPSAGLVLAARGNRGPYRIGRSLTKLLGLAGCLAGVALLYWLLPEYHGRFYQSYYAALWAAGPWAALAAFPYLLWVDRQMVAPHDGYYHLGRLLLLERTGRDWRVLRELAAGWAVKGFFLPLMFVYCADDIAWILSVKLDLDALYRLLHRGIFCVDVTFAAVGYMMTFRVLDAHIRSVEPTLAGAVSALVCYQPFWSLVGRHYLSYGDGHSWGRLLEPWPVLRACCGAAIILLFVVYVWATVTFGLRFSNLTHRGILVHGPYRWLKHPAYVAKNLSWWLTSLPFVPRGPGRTIKLGNIFRLAGLNLVYALRASTEQRHLRRDPVYGSYEQLMERRGIYGRLKLWFWRQRRGETATS